MSPAFFLSRLALIAGTIGSHTRNDWKHWPSVPLRPPTIPLSLFLVIQGKSTLAGTSNSSPSPLFSFSRVSASGLMTKVAGPMLDGVYILIAAGGLVHSFRCRLGLWVFEGRMDGRKGGREHDG